ncbi:MAG: tetraacyldisaccharide 4'-kinase [Bacteroidota bacterium]
MLPTFISGVFKYFVERNNAKFDKEEIALTKVACPVISVGNLSVGGTGKTPFVIMLAKFLLDSGIKPAIIGKGYKRKSKGELIISDGNTIFSDYQNAGDEMYLVAKSLAVPVVVHNEKYLAAQTAFENFKPDCIIIDDGFQHRRLHRDIDIVLIDKDTAERPFLIPKGRLREPLSSLQRADVVVYTDVFDTSQITKHLKDSCISIRTISKTGDVYSLKDKSTFNPGEADNNCIAFCGIANPARFNAALFKAGINPKDTICFNDHHNYSQKDISKIINVCKKYSAAYAVTTEKDAVKLSLASEQFEANNIQLAVLPVYTKIIEGEKDFCDYILSCISHPELGSGSLDSQGRC